MKRRIMLRYYRRGTSCTLEHLRGKESAEETVNYERDDVKQTTRDDGNPSADSTDLPQLIEEV